MSITGEASDLEAISKWPSIDMIAIVNNNTHAFTKYNPPSRSWKHIQMLYSLTLPEADYALLNIANSVPFPTPKGTMKEYLECCDVFMPVSTSELAMMQQTVFYNMSTCGKVGCGEICHTRIIDPRKGIILEPKANCCRNAIATVERQRKYPSAKHEKMYWICKAITTAMFASSCCPLRSLLDELKSQGGDDKSDIAGRLMMTVAVTTASCLMCIKSDWKYKKPKLRLRYIRYTTDRLVIGFAWSFIGYCQCYLADRTADYLLTKVFAGLPDLCLNAAFAWAAYEIGMKDTPLNELVRNPYTRRGELALDSLVAILNRRDLVEELNAFKTSDSYIEGKCITNFAEKVFSAHLPLRRCNVSLPRVWDMENDRLVPYKSGTHMVGFISHVWSDDEVTYAHCTGEAVPQDNAKLTAIKQQLLPICRYWWMDTLCINKEDLAELDMSIRSMHAWYSAASVVAVPDFQDLNLWMSRGWCLQEGNAAKALLINTSELPRGGDQMVQTLRKMGCVSGKIPASFWLSLMQNRMTTRLEDKAYALIGLLNIDFQIMYGEGKRSWNRLIEQIAIQHGDISWMIGDLTVGSFDTSSFIPKTIIGGQITPQISDYPVKVSPPWNEIVGSANRCCLCRFVPRTDETSSP
jgi:hypothetical protein